MLFNLSILREYLLSRHQIPSYRVQLNADFRKDLQLSELDINQLIRMITQQTGIPFHEEQIKHLTDVFDLLVHVILRLPEGCDSEYYFGPIPPGLAGRLSGNNYAPALVNYAATYVN